MKIFIALVIIVIAFIVAIPRYLGPNDLAQCAEPSLGTCAPADAIVVVSGGDTNARVQESVTLFKQGWAGHLIFSGAAADQTGLSNALAMKNYAVKLGVSESFISIEEFSRTTEENALNTSRLIEQNNMSRIILVTSAYHQRRVSLEFERRLSDDVTIINKPVSEDRQWSSFWWSTSAGWWLVSGELAKIMVFYASPGTTI